LAFDEEERALYSADEMGFVIKWDIGGVIDKLRMIGQGMKQEAKPVVVEAEGEDSIGSMEGASE
jgi:hypothetical protein